MTRNKMLASLVSLAALSVLAAGCELIVDFDRTKIPVEATDSGIVTIPDATATDTGAATDAAKGDTGGATDGGQTDAEAGIADAAVDG